MPQGERQPNCGREATILSTNQQTKVGLALLQVILSSSGPQAKGNKTGLVGFAFNGTTKNFRQWNAYLYCGQDLSGKKIGK